MWSRAKLLEAKNILVYSSVRILAIALIAISLYINKSHLVPKGTMNVKFVRLLASKFHAKFDLLLPEH